MSLTPHEQGLFDFAEDVRTKPASLGVVMNYRDFYGTGASRGCMAFGFAYATESPFEHIAIDVLKLRENPLSPEAIRTVLFHVVELDNAHKDRRLGHGKDDQLFRVETLAMQTGNPLAYLAEHNTLFDAANRAYASDKPSNIEQHLRSLSPPPVFEAETERPIQLDWRAATSSEMAGFHRRVMGLKLIADQAH